MAAEIQSRVRFSTGKEEEKSKKQPGYSLCVIQSFFSSVYWLIFRLDLPQRGLPLCQQLQVPACPWCGSLAALGTSGWRGGLVWGAAPGSLLQIKICLFLAHEQAQQRLAGASLASVPQFTPWRIPAAQSELLMSPTEDARRGEEPKTSTPSPWALPGEILH